MDVREDFIASLSPVVENKEVHAVVQEVAVSPLPSQWHGKGRVSTKRVKRVSLVCFIIILIPLLIALYHSFLTGPKIKNLYDSVFSFSGLVGEDNWGKEFSYEEELIFYGDKTASSELEKWKALHTLHPTTPEFFIDYAEAKIKESGALDEEDWAFINTYDADNGIYDILHLTKDTSEIMEDVSPDSSFKKSSKEESPRTVYEILDDAAYQDQLALLKKAYSRGSLRTYSQELIQAKNEIIGSTSSYTEVLQRLLILAAQSTHVTECLKCVALITAASQDAEKRENWEEIEELWNISQWLIHEQLDSSFTLIEALVARACIHGLAKEFYYATQNHPNQVLKGKAEALFRKAEDYRIINRDETLRDQRGEKLNETMNLRGDQLSIMSTPAVGRAAFTEIAVDEDRIIAGQRMEQAFIMGRILSPIVLILFVIIAMMVHSIRWRGLDSLTHHIGAHSSKRCCFAVLILSSVVPLGGFFIARYFLSFGALDYGIKAGLSFGVTYHYTVFWFTFSALLYSPIVWGNLVSPFERGRKHQFLILGLIYVGLFTAFIAIPTPERRIFAYINVGLLLGILLVLLFKGGVALNGSLKHKVVFSGKRHILLPCYALSVILLSLLPFHFHAEELHWALQDHVLNSPYGGFSYYEDMVTQEAVRECRELMK